MKIIDLNIIFQFCLAILAQIIIDKYDYLQLYKAHHVIKQFHCQSIHCYSNNSFILILIIPNLTVITALNKTTAQYGYVSVPSCSTLRALHKTDTDQVAVLHIHIMIKQHIVASPHIVDQTHILQLVQKASSKAMRNFLM